LVQDGVYDAFTQRLAETAGAMKVADGFEPGAVIGPLVDMKAVEKVEAHIADALKKQSQGGGGRPRAKRSRASRPLQARTNQFPIIAAVSGPRRSLDHQIVAGGSGAIAHQQRIHAPGNRQIIERYARAADAENRIARRVGRLKAIARRRAL
jgi:hypothetical protein